MRTLPKSPFVLRSALAALLPLAALLAVTPLDAKPKHHTEVAAQQPVATPTITPEEEQDDNGVAAIVNDQIVSEYDLRQRLALVISTSGMQPTPDVKRKLRPQVLEQLKTEKLELEEAQRKNITVTPAEVDREIDGIVKDNHLTMDQLKGILGRDNVDFSTLRSQIAVQLAWQKAIEDEYGDRINITPADVDEEMARVTEGANKPHYLVAEIFLPVETPEQDAKVLKNAQDLETQLQNGSPFPSIARQFSQSPTAANGGDIGWVHEGQLTPELNSALTKMTVGGVSQPIRSSGGYYILGLRDRQEPAGTKLPDVNAPQPGDKPGYLPLARLLLPLPPKPPKTYLDAAMKAAMEIRAHTTSCAQLQKMSAAMKGSVFMNLGEMKLSDLSAQMQGELAKTQAGQPTAPFISPAGIEVIARCDKAVPKLSAFVIPTRDQVERQLFQQQISTLARRYIRDLRRNANVETR